MLNISEPFFSVVIPTYNRANFVKECVASVLSQDFDNYEIIVIDDGSIDNTQEILEPYAKKIKYIKRPNKGAEEARNQGLLSSKGKYIVFLDSDDCLMPYALHVYYKVIKTASPAIIISRGKGFKEKINIALSNKLTDIEYIKSKDYFSKHYSVWLSNSFLVIERESIIQAQIFFNKNTFPVDDLDFILRAGTLSPFIYILNPFTIAYRIHNSNSIHCIGANIKGLNLIIDKEQKGEYPGGKKRKIERLAVIGGHVQSWIRRGIAAGFYQESLLLLLRSFFAIWCSIIRKIYLLLLRGSVQKHVIELEHNKSQLSIRKEM